MPRGRLTPETSAKAAASNQSRAANNKKNRKAAELINALVTANLSYVAIAARLNRTGFLTSQGCTLEATQAMRLARVASRLIIHRK